MTSAEYPVVIVNFIARTKNSQEGFANLFFKIKICASVLFKNFAFASLVRTVIRSDPDPKFPKKSDPDTIRI